MADQARELNEMMSRYRVMSGSGESLSASEPPAAAVERAPAAAAAKPMVERRSKNRPWSGKRSAAAAATNGSAGHAVPVAARKQASNSDSDWQEF
jgi:hypothetical protein